MHTSIKDMMIMKKKLETVPTRITAYFQSDVCSRRKTNRRIAIIKGNEIRK